MAVLIGSACPLFRRTKLEGPWTGSYKQTSVHLHSPTVLLDLFQSRENHERGLRPPFLQTGLEAAWCEQTSRVYLYLAIHRANRGPLCKNWTGRDVTSVPFGCYQQGIWADPLLSGEGSPPCERGLKVQPGIAKTWRFLYQTQTLCWPSWIITCVSSSGDSFIGLPVFYVR